MSGEITVLLVTVGGKRFALDASDVMEVLPVVAHRSAGTGPKWLLGLFNLRGRLLPLVDLSTLVDGSMTDVRLGSRIVVMRLEGDLFEGSSRPIGLLVPEVSGLVRRDFS
ncbi:MAG: chemotaxis protein CheW, partial [bacterium]